MGDLHSKLLQTRREIYLRLKETAVSYDIQHSAELENYYKAQEAYEKKKFDVVSSEEFLKSVDRSQIIYLGDFHTFDQSSKNFKRLIKFLLQQNKELIIGLEMVSSSQQQKINSFIKGQITDKEFLEDINYKESWRFPWVHYSELFSIAKEKNISIFGLNSEGSLEKRDDHAATIISKVINKHKEAQFLILFGELHILPDKLPGKVRSKINGKFEDLIVHQNLDSIYWKQLETSPDGRIGSSIVRLEKNEFSLQNSPPWIKLESYIYWFENLMDDPDFDLHEYSIENSIKLFNENVYDNFCYLASKICDSLGLKIDTDLLNEFNLYDHQSLEYVLKETLKHPNKDFYQKLIKNNQFFHIVDTDIYYCPSYSINRITYIVGCHIFHSITKRAKQVVAHDTKANQFYYWVNQFSFSYFCTKILNPYRKCSLVADIRNDYEQTISDQSTSIGNENVLAITLDTFDQTISDEFVEEHNYFELHESAKLIGNCLGDFIYSHYHDIGKSCIDIKLKSAADISLSRPNLHCLIEEIKRISPNFFTKSKKMF